MRKQNQIQNPSVYLHKHLIHVVWSSKMNNYYYLMNYSLTAIYNETDKLDEIYLCDEHIMAFKDFYSYKRTAGVNIYKYLYQKWHKFGITLPEGVEAFLVLNTAKVSEEKEKLINKWEQCA